MDCKRISAAVRGLEREQTEIPFVQMKNSTFGTRSGTTQTRINTGFAPPCPNVLVKINNIIINFLIIIIVIERYVFVP